MGVSTGNGLPVLMRQTNQPHGDNEMGIPYNTKQKKNVLLELRGVLTRLCNDNGVFAVQCTRTASDSGSGEWRFDSNMEAHNNPWYSVYKTLAKAVHQTVNEIKNDRLDNQPQDDNLSGGVQKRIEDKIDSVNSVTRAWRENLRVRFDGDANPSVETNNQEARCYITVGYINHVLRAFQIEQSHTDGWLHKAPYLEGDKYVVGTLYSAHKTHDEDLECDLNVWDCDLICAVKNSHGYLNVETSRETVVFANDITQLHATHGDEKSAVRLYKRRHKAEFFKQLMED